MNCSTEVVPVETAVVPVEKESHDSEEKPDVYDAFVEALPLVRIEECLEWMKRELPLGGLPIPRSEQTCVLFAAKALELAEDARCYSPKQRERYAQAEIVRQCWEYQRKLQDKARRSYIIQNKVIPVVHAVKHLRRIDGESQPHLMEASDGLQYVVKFPNNPRGRVSLATEMICNEAARLMGLPVPPMVILRVDKELIRETKALRMELPHKTVQCEAGFCLGIPFIDSATSTILGRVPPEFAHGGRNFSTLVGGLVFDIWALNTQGRQSVLFFDHTSGRHRLLFIDQSRCLSGSEWYKFCLSGDDAPVAEQPMAERIRSWRHLAPWMCRVGQVKKERLLEIAFHIPESWYGGRRGELIAVIQKLISRGGISISGILIRLERQGYFPNLRQPSRSQREVTLDQEDVDSNSLGTEAI